MRRFIDIVEGKTYQPVLETFPRVTLRAGTPLWHGSDEAGDREMQNGPAFFAWREKKATEWVGWATAQHPGPKRVWQYVVERDVVLLDLDAVPQDSTGLGWARFCEMLTGEFDELGPNVAARAMKEAGSAEGWLATGRDGEVMLCHPERYLRFIGVRNLK